MTNKWVSFFISNERYCANISSIKEILPYQQANPFPGADQNTEGILSIRGEVLTILNGDKIFSCENITPKNNIIVIEDESEHRLGISIDDIDQIIEVEPEQIERPTDKTNDFIIGTVNTEEHLYILVDFKSLIDVQQGLSGDPDSLVSTN